MLLAHHQQNKHFASMTGYETTLYKGSAIIKTTYQTIPEPIIENMRGLGYEMTRVKYDNGELRAWFVASNLIQQKSNGLCQGNQRTTLDKVIH